jgi:hypothetical protein
MITYKTARHEAVDNLLPEIWALLRKHKPWCFGAEPQPPVTPLSSELAKALPSSPSSV